MSVANSISCKFVSFVHTSLLLLGLSVVDTGFNRLELSRWTCVLSLLRIHTCCTDTILYNSFSRPFDLRVNSPHPLSSFTKRTIFVNYSSFLVGR